MGRAQGKAWEHLDHPRDERVEYSRPLNSNSHRCPQPKQSIQHPFSRAEQDLGQKKVCLVVHAVALSNIALESEVPGPNAYTIPTGMHFKLRNASNNNT